MPHRSTSCSNPSVGSSRRRVQGSVYCGASTTTVSSPRSSLGEKPSFTSASKSRCSFGVIQERTRALASNGVGPLDLVLQLHDAVEQRLGGRRAAGHID